MNSIMDTHSLDLEHVFISRSVEGHGVKGNANAMQMQCEIAPIEPHIIKLDFTSIVICWSLRLHKY